MAYNGEHIPVLLAETLGLLSPKPGEVVFDGTVGGGGHARALLQRVLPDGRLIGIDRDAEVLKVAAANLPSQPQRCVLIKANFADFAEVLDSLGVPEVDVALLDLGVSSFQFDQADRGFSFQRDGPLDMRMDRQSERTAADLVNELGEQDLADLFYQYGQERRSRRIARRIVGQRRKGRIETTGQLARLVLASQPKGARGRRYRIHPATRVFQALRIAVNRELEDLERFCRDVAGRLTMGGRAGIISFHSLEDRIVKTAFRRLAADGVLEVLTRKPVTPSREERQSNPRSRSAKLRATRRTGGSL